MAMLFCVVCGKGPTSGISTLYRVNPKGAVGVWACPDHYQRARVDPAVLEITDILAGRDSKDTSAT